MVWCPRRVINRGQGCSGSLGTKAFPGTGLWALAPALPRSSLPAQAPNAVRRGLVGVLLVLIQFPPEVSCCPHPQSQSCPFPSPGTRTLVQEATACHLPSAPRRPRPLQPASSRAATSRPPSRRPAPPRPAGVAGAALETAANRARPRLRSGGGAPLRGRGQRGSIPCPAEGVVLVITAFKDGELWG